MLACFLCPLLFKNIETYINHLKIKHFAEYKGNSFFCKQGNCLREFQALRSFRKHLETKHKLDEISDNLSDDGQIFYSSEDVPSYSDINNAVAFNENESDFNESVSVLNDSVNVLDESVSTDANDHIDKHSVSSVEDDVKKAAAIFLARLHASNNVNRKTVQEVIVGVQELLKKVLPSLKEEVLNSLVALNCDQEMLFRIADIFNISLNMFDGLSTEFKRLKYFKDNGFYTPPLEYTIETTLDFVQKNNTVVLEEVKCTGQYVMMAGTLKKILSVPGTFAELMAHYSFLKNSDVFQNLIQGEIWKDIESSYQGKIVLPLLIYYDDFTHDNPLGPHKGKIGAVYYTIACLPQNLLAKLENLFLVMLFKADYRQKFGNAKTFAPLIKELIQLETVGVDLDLGDNKITNIRFCVSLIIGDNLGLHGILGFTECFNSNFCCRFCKCPKAIFQKSLFSLPEYFRTIEDYDKDALVCNVSESGIKELCIFNEIPSFHVIKNSSCDLMHDFYEGVCRYVMASLILKLCKLNYFDLDTFNGRLNGFKYGAEEFTNKPSTIRVEKLKNYNLGVTAAEMIFIVHYFGLLIGDRVPEDSIPWKLYIKLKQISVILMSRAINDPLLQNLKFLVAELNEIFLNEFNEHLRFKFHILCHYHEIMAKVGPAVNIWCMRFEGKHKEIQAAVKVSCNRVNSALTMAMKQQLKLNYMIMMRSDSKSCDFVIDNKERINADENLSIYYLPENFKNNELFTAAKIKKNSYSYKSGTVMYINMNEIENMPEFCEIFKIFVDENDISIFVCKTYQTIRWYDHIQAYQVSLHSSSSFKSYLLEDFMSLEPVVVRHFQDGNKYIVNRSDF